MTAFDVANVVVSLVVVAALGVVIYRMKRGYDRLRVEMDKAVADAKSNGEAFLREKQAELDTVVGATFISLRDRILARTKADPSMTLTEAFEHEEALQMEAPAAVVQSLREKQGLADTAIQATRVQALMASQEVQNVNAENTLVRSLLTQALQLPIDTPAAHREMFLRRCNMVLTAPRPTHDCPSDDVWKSYVARHVATHGDPFATPSMEVAGGEVKH